MTALRGIGMLLLPLCGWLVGDAVQTKTAEQLAALQGTIRLLQRIRQEILFRRADLQQLLRQLRQEKWITDTAASLQTLPAPPALTSAQKQCFAECMSGLGRNAAEQEGERLDYYIARFTAELQQAQQSAQARAGLPHRLGLAAGAVLALAIM